MPRSKCADLWAAPAARFGVAQREIEAETGTVKKFAWDFGVGLGVGIKSEEN